MLRTLALYFACALAVLLGSMPPPAEALEKWGPFRGRIVDVETGQPIVGAAILVVWYEAVPTPVQTNQKFFDAHETVSGPDGFFEVARKSPPFFSFRILPPEIMIFVPGYAEQNEHVNPPDGQPFVDPTEIHMRRLKTRRELWDKSRARPGGVPDDKMPGLLRAVNVERKMLGLDPVGPAPGR